jgi:hypothetical protein
VRSSSSPLREGISWTDTPKKLYHHYRGTAQVRLQKTYGNVTAPQTAAQRAETRAQSAKPAASASKTPQPAARQAAIRSLPSLISAAGLPADKLSASIISFARFFSLPLKPELLKHIRQQAFTMTHNTEPSNPVRSAQDGVSETGTLLKNREALSLAASASEGKGVELQPESLEAYAEALDPEWRKRQDGGQNDQRGRREKNDNDKDSEETASQKTAAISAEGIEKLALEGAEKNPLLAILNRLPQKDGKRWIVLPFDFSANGIEFKVSLRILLETGETVNRAACMALDVATRKKRCLFVLEPANRLSVYLQPEIKPAQQATLARELSALLEIAPDRIFIKTKTEAFPFESGLGDGLSGTIDEAV